MTEYRVREQIVGRAWYRVAARVDRNRIEDRAAARARDRVEVRAWDRERPLHSSLRAALWEETEP